jgi:hypothetical protein
MPTGLRGHARLQLRHGHSEQWLWQRTITCLLWE